MKDSVFAARYARTPVTTYLPSSTAPETSKILRVAAALAIATGIGVTLVSGQGPDLATAFGRSGVAHVDHDQALDVMRIQAYGSQSSWSGPSYR